MEFLVISAEIDIGNRTMSIDKSVLINWIVQGIVHGIAHRIVSMNSAMAFTWIFSWEIRVRG